MNIPVRTTEADLRGRFLAIRRRVLDGTAIVEEVLEAQELIRQLQAFQAVRDHDPKP